MTTKADVLRPKRWSLMVACNDYRNGMFRGRVSAIEIGAGRGNFEYGTDYLDDYELNLAACGTEPRFRWIGDDAFKLSRWEFPCTGIRDWVGNWCWDACFVDRAVIRRLMPILKRLEFLPASGSPLLWEWFNRLEPTA